MRIPGPVVNGLRTDEPLVVQLGPDGFTVETRPTVTTLTIHPGWSPVELPAERWLEIGRAEDPPGRVFVTPAEARAQFEEALRRPIDLEALSKALRRPEHVGRHRAGDCGTCGWVRMEQHPRLPEVLRCSNCKEHLARTAPEPADDEDDGSICCAEHEYGVDPYGDLWH